MALVSVSLNDSVDLQIPSIAPKEMISVSISPGGETKVRINSSSLGMIQECMRKSQLSLKQGWKPEFSSPATTFGSAIHKALEVFYCGNENEERILPKLESVELMAYGHAPVNPTDLITRSFKAFIDSAQPLSALPQTDKRSIHNGVWILWHYFKAFLDDPFIVYRDEKGPFVERDFSFILHSQAGLTIEYFGRIDLALRNKRTDEIFIADHKTSSIIGNDFYNRLKPNHQYTGYLMGAREHYKLDINSFMINCLQVKAKPLTSRGSPPDFPRQITTRDQADYEEFREVVIDSVTRYLRASAEGIWPLGYTNACAQYGGCTYLSVCQAPLGLRENILKAKFTRQGGDANV